MLAKLRTFALIGIDAHPVEAEVDVGAAPCGLCQRYGVQISSIFRDVDVSITRSWIRKNSARPGYRKSFGLSETAKKPDA